MKIFLRCVFILLTVISANIVQVVNAEVYSGTPRTIAHDFLDLEKPFGSGIEHEKYLNKLINKTASRISVKKDYSTEEAIKAMSIIYHVLKEEGFVFEPNLLLYAGLDKKAIDCDTYSALYTAVSEVIRLPVIPVYSPNHSFVRFNFNDGTYLNWEPIEGKHYPDAYYIKKLNIADQSINLGVYLKSLSRKEFTGVEYNNLGAYLMSKRKFKKSIPYFDEAIKLYPKFSSAYHNRGTAYYAINKTDQAFTNLDYANNLDPMRASTHNTLGDIYLDRKEPMKAFDQYAESIKLDPKNFAPYYGLGIIMQNAGKTKEADEWFRKSKEIKRIYGN